MSDLRKTFWDIILEIAKEDKDVIVLVDDLGFSFCEKFQKELPEQFINCGVIEQSMFGIAAGLALGGLKPYLYGTAPFLVFRPYEQIRDDICYNALDVKIIGTGASGFLGFSHNLNPSNEDELILKHLPNLEIYIPKSTESLEKVLLKSYQHVKPTYIRL